MSDAWRRLALLAVPALLWASDAAAFRVDVDAQFRGLDVEVVVHSSDMETGLIMAVTNNEPTDVRCHFQFRNGPEVTRRRRILLEPGETLPVRHSPGRSVVRMRVMVRCEALEETGS